MNFDEIIELLQGEEPDIPGIIEGLGGLRTASEGANARIAELEQAVVELENKYQQTAAKNWELMQAMTAEPEPEPESDEDEGEEGEDPFAELF
nr:MAG TPA: RNA polymerase II subunit [Caudoviricetes sp.]